MNNILDEVWSRAVGGLDWLKQVVLGEFEDHRDLSAVVADMLVSFVPGVVIVTSARDLTAVVLRLAKHPERREQLEEWMLLVACAVPLVLPVLAAAAGAAAAGVGAVVGGIAGSEAGAVLRAVCLPLINKGAHVLAEVVGFLRRFVKGDILKVLRDIRFAQYSQALTKYIAAFVGRLAAIVQRVKAELLAFRALAWVADLLERLDELERAFYAVQSSALQAIPKALVELDIRLQQMLAEALPHNPRPAMSGVPAPLPVPTPAKPERVPAMPGNPLGHPEGTRSPGPPPKGTHGPNLHPETPREPKPTPRKPRQPRSTNKNIEHSRTIKHPDGSVTYYDKQGRQVTYNAHGYPDFSPFSEAEVKVVGLKGSIPPDDGLANKAVGLKTTPDGYTWHHVEDGQTMQLVPTDLHATFPHSGGASAIRNGQ